MTNCKVLTGLLFSVILTAYCMDEASEPLPDMSAETNTTFADLDILLDLIDGLPDVRKGTITFKIGDQTLLPSVEKASIEIFLRKPSTGSSVKIEVKDQDDNILAATTRDSPTTPIQSYIVDLDRDLLRKSLAGIGSDNTLSLTISAKTDGLEDLFVLPGTQDAEVVLDLRYPAKREKNRHQRVRSYGFLIVFD